LLEVPMRILFVTVLSIAVLLGACSKKTNNSQQAPVAASEQKFPPVISQQAAQTQNNAPVRMNTLIAPLSAEAAKSDNRILSQAVFICSNKSKFTAVFKPGQAEITDGLRGSIVIPQVMAASGFWYKNAKYELRGKGGTALWTIGNKAPLTCTVAR
jgi:membrane-bound inhibitor of C-type lysozyme